MGKLDHELAALADMDLDALRERWSEVDDRPAPSVPVSVLRSLIAYRLQEKRHGSLPALVRRELSRVARDDDSSAPRLPALRLSPGTRLVREWNGQTITVEVTEDGFRYDDRDWNTLSQIACHITGAHWSGPRFFGLTNNG